MVDLATVLCILLLLLCDAVALVFLIRTVIDGIRDLLRTKQNDKWEEERRQFERQRAQQDAEYHEARMKQFE